MPATDHFLDEAELGMRNWRLEIMWVKSPKNASAETPDLVENKAIYRAEVRAES